MKLFIIHRFTDNHFARSTLKKIEKDTSISIKCTFLNSSGNESWKKRAEKSIKDAEAVIVYNPAYCSESVNAKWEIDKANDIGKEVIEVFHNNENTEAKQRLKSLYNLDNEFNECFKKDDPDIIELYKLMLETSEQLIQRRQKTNAFFITAIGTILAIAGLLIKTNTINTGSIGILYAFSIIGLLLCNSWSNLIDNYGKLNTAKYKVILELEKKLDAQIFSAEWVALGKGLRPKKYRSFTSTEQNVPLFFAVLITALTLIAVVWKIWG